MVARSDRDREDAALEDSEIDFDDERAHDQSPLDRAEASELGIELDEPGELPEDEDELPDEEELPDDEDELLDYEDDEL